MKVLFICASNAARGQFAQAMLRATTGDSVEALSAGVEPRDRLHPLAVEVMNDLNLDFSGQYPKHADTYLDEYPDLVVTIGKPAKQKAPAYRGNPCRIHWAIEDPYNGPDVSNRKEDFLDAATQIKARMSDLADTIKRTTWSRHLAWEPAISTMIVSPEPFDMEKYIAMIADAGFKAVELDYFDWTDEATAKAFRSVTSDCGIQVWSIHSKKPFLSSNDEAARRSGVEVLKRTLEGAHVLGARAIPIHVGLLLEEGQTPEEAEAALEKSFEELRPHTEASSAVLCWENDCAPSYSRFSGEEMCALIDSLPASGYGLVLDTSHGRIEGSLNRLAEAAGPRLSSVHISDNMGETDDHTIPGEGVIDWKEFIATLVSAGYTGPLMLEVAGTGNVAARLAKCMDAYKRLRDLVSASG